MTTDVFSPDEQALLDAWFRSVPIDEQLDGLLKAAGFERDCGPYTRLDAWVGAFAVAEIQGRLPNCGINGPAGIVLNRKFREVGERKVSGMTRHLFTINWADSGPGVSWPVAYTLVWIPVFEQFVVVASADGDDAFGYPDFALGHFPAGGDWLAQVKDIVVPDWRSQYDGWNQAPWAYLFDSGAVPEAETMAWRREVWRETESWDEEEPEEEEDDQEENEEDQAAREAEPWQQAPETLPPSPFGPVTHVWIRLKRWKEVPPTPEHDYSAEIIKDGDDLYYRAKGTTVPVTEFEALSVVDNPFLYYFSTALKLHMRIERETKSQVGEEGAK